MNTLLIMQYILFIILKNIEKHRVFKFFLYSPFSIFQVKLATPLINIFLTGQLMKFCHICREEHRRIRVSLRKFKKRNVCWSLKSVVDFWLVKYSTSRKEIMCPYKHGQLSKLIAQIEAKAHVHTNAHSRK